VGFIVFCGFVGLCAAYGAALPYFIAPPADPDSARDPEPEPPPPPVAVALQINDGNVLDM